MKRHSIYTYLLSALTLTTFFTQGVRAADCGCLPPQQNYPKPYPPYTPCPPAAGDCQPACSDECVPACPPPPCAAQGSGDCYPKAYSAPRKKKDCYKGYQAAYYAPPVWKNPCYSFTGFYIGANLSYGVLEIAEKRTILPGMVNAMDKATFSARNFLIGINGGYGYLFQNNWYLGADLLANYSNINRLSYNVWIPGARYGYRFTLRDKYGVALLVGRRCSIVLPYVKIGYANSRFRAAYAVNRKVVKNSRLSGLDLGLGIKGYVRDNIIVAAEYTYTEYGKTSLSFLPFFNITSLQPRLNTLTVGVSYIF